MKIYLFISFLLFIVLLAGCSPGSGTIQLGNATKAIDSSGNYAVPGKLIAAWENSFSGSLYTPIVFSDRILVGDKSGKIYVLNTETGSKISELKYKGLLNVAPVVTGDTAVIFMIYDEKKISSTVYRYLPGLKREEKLAELPGPARNLISVSDSIVAVTVGRILYVLSGGAVTEKYTFPGFIKKTVSDSRGRIFVLTENGELKILNNKIIEARIPESTGVSDIELFSDSLIVEMSEGNSANRFSENKRIIIKFNNNGKAARYQGKLSPEFLLTGLIKDTIRISTPDYYTFPLILNSGLITCGTTGNVYYYNFNSGKASIQFNFGERISASPVIAGNMLILCGEEGNVAAYTLNKVKE